ncbi:hypothetical protein ABB37_07071 [Leptomonas pyrrhocoris]|uniref:Transmembrane protein n=1 Tax=Leptomonas pyrrhocoris TaxID=157538 RepID=A0A0M9FW25_LEPPY|nr:hypothetical protein ABB37_07071 [Leptomonas pyrrhocoris]KPA77139.1 hypothetical protein ABB37_07071 [Leptomonas pyrrhocoris]|eukprot:XP_015655578.1 hypothetical protein ABB37_07071 [Leptomonas pyrrhocoris]
MVPWGPLQRQLMTYLARHPQFQKAIKNASQRVVAHSTFQKAKKSVYSAFEKAGENAARGASTAGQGAGRGASESTFGRWKRKSAEQWQTHLVKAASFIFANFMTLLILIQFGPMLWHYCKNGVLYLTSANQTPEKEHGEKRRRKRSEKTESAETTFQIEAADGSMRRAILQSVPQPVGKGSCASEPAPPAAPSRSQWSPSSSLFDDTTEVGKSADVQQTFNSMHNDVFRTPDGGAQIDFNTSFLVKMGDETTFTSSLEREGLTGSTVSRS